MSLNREEMDAIKRAAAENTGLGDFGSPFYQGPLSAWVDDLRQANINEFGKKFLHRLVRKDLERRLKVIDTFKKYPEILEVGIPPILFITGAPRTGTTLLHHLLAAHPLGRPLLRWELMEPLPPPEVETYASDPRIAKLQASIEPLRGSLLEKMHWVNADEPEENAWGFIDCTGLLGCGIRPLMPAWSRFLAEHDLAPSFRDFRNVLRLLLWKNPPVPGGHLVLKCVMATQWIESFAHTFPEAEIVVTHRDPFRSLVSSCTAGDAICQPFIRDHPGPLDREGIRTRSTFNLQKNVLRALTSQSSAESDRIVHIQYADLMADAVATVRGIYDQIEMPAPADLEPAILGYLKAQREGKRAAPPKKLDAYAYDPDEVWNDPLVAEYAAFFGVQRERVRLTDTRTGA